MTHTFRPRKVFDMEVYDRNFPSDNATKLRYWLIKSERIWFCKVKPELLLWTALKRPLHKICQECRRMHCKKAPTKGSKRTQSSQPPWKEGGIMQHTEAIFPPSTKEDCSILSTHTHSSQWKTRTQNLYIRHFVDSKAYVVIVATVRNASFSHGKSCCRIKSSIIDCIRC